MFSRGRHPKLSYADILLVRELFKAGRDGAKKLSATEVGAKFGVSRETVYRAWRMDEAELKMVRERRY